MKKYLAFFRLRSAMGLQYRAAALAGIATQFAWGFIEIMAMHVFYTENTCIAHGFSSNNILHMVTTGISCSFFYMDDGK